MPEERQREILKILQNSIKPIKGGELAKRLGVSRQVIVQDIALLRAKGETIIATPQGYLLFKEDINSKTKKVIACQHDYKGMKRELEIIVNNGGKILDVIVEHPLYGELRGNLMLENFYDINHFINKLKESGAEPLSILTKGIHLHTVEASSSEVLNKIEEKLKEEKILIP